MSWSLEGPGVDRAAWIDGPIGDGARWAADGALIALLAAAAFGGRAFGGWRGRGRGSDALGADLRNRDRVGCVPSLPRRAGAPPYGVCAAAGGAGGLRRRSDAGGREDQAGPVRPATIGGRTPIGGLVADAHRRGQSARTRAGSRARSGLGLGPGLSANPRRRPRRNRSAPRRRRRSMSPVPGHELRQSGRKRRIWRETDMRL